MWDESIVKEWSDVAWDAQMKGTEVNLGYLFALCVEKNSELPAGHPKRKFKGRCVPGKPRYQPELGSGDIPGPWFLPGDDGGF